MGWIESVHSKCQMPENGPRGTFPPGRGVGDLWRCPHCDKLWRITGGFVFWFWQEATRREVKRYKDQGRD